MFNPSRQHEEYVVRCDRCHGRMFVDGLICPKCNGDGRILIIERRQSRFWKWLKRRLGITAWHERRQRQRRDEARCNMGIYGKYKP